MPIMPKVSIIITNTENERDLLETLTSLFRQAFRKLEIIVVIKAKGASDLSVLDVPEDMVIHIVHSIGTCHADFLNDGIQFATGKYILPLNLGDKLASSFIQEAGCTLEANPQIGIIYCDVVVSGSSDRDTVMTETTPADLLFKNIVLGSVLFRKIDWDTIQGYDPRFEAGWTEWDFYLSLVEKGLVIHRIPRLLCRIYSLQNLPSASADNRQSNSQFDQLFKKHERLYRLNPEQQTETVLDFRTVERQINQLYDRVAELIRRNTERIRQIGDLRSELNIIKGSKIWRLAEFLRRLFYIRLIGKLPQVKAFIRRCCGTIPSWWAQKQDKDAFDPVNDYIVWMKANRLDTTQVESIREEAKSFGFRPKISIVMPVYNVDESWLVKAITSVTQQFYDNWELCIVDDGSNRPHIRQVLECYRNRDNRIQCFFLEKNQGISAASNVALNAATGQYVGFLDHDDELAPEALYEVLKRLNRNRSIDLIYSDEDKIDTEGNRFDPFFKSDWSPDTLRSYNYICHLAVIRKRLLDEIGGFREGYEGSQDYDLFLRVIEITRQIDHIPKVLYHWRSIEGSVCRAMDAKMYAYENGKKTLRDHIKRLGINGSVNDGPRLGTYHIRYHLKERPEVTIIIATRDQVDMLRNCLDSILNRTRYDNYRIVIVDNHSVKPTTQAYFEQISVYPKIRILSYDEPFNFPAINNFAVTQVSSPYLLFLNNDTEVITEDWIDLMLGYVQRSDVGAAGAQLYYPDDTIQHAGVIVGIGGVAGHLHKHFQRESLGYYCRIKIDQNLTAVTGACLMTKRSVFNAVDGFDEKLSHAFNDVDFCLKIRRKGFLVVYVSQAELYHHESISRGYEDTSEKLERFTLERHLFYSRWYHELAKGDPYYNPNLTTAREDCTLWRPTDSTVLEAAWADLEIRRKKQMEYFKSEKS